MWLFNNSKNSHSVICYSWLTSTRELLRNPVNCPCCSQVPQKHWQLSLSGPQHRTDIIVVDKLLVYG